MSLSVLDYIKVYNGLEKTLCDDVVKHFKHSPSWEVSTFSSNTGYSANSHESVKMQQYWVETSEPYQEELANGFRKVVEEYISTFNKVEPMIFTRFRLNWYGVGGFMRNHIDSIHHSHGQKYGYPHITALGFLNDEYEGGEFSLCDGEMVLQPNVGDIVVFPSNFMYPHEVKKVTSGDRFTCMTWIM